MTEREMLEKDGRGAVHQRTAEAFAAPDDVDETTLVQRLEHAANADATNLLDLGAADRLPIGDDRQRLERGGGKPLRSRRELRALDRFGVLGAGEDLPTAGDLLELHAVAVDVVVLAQLVDGGSESGQRVVRGGGMQLLGRDRARAREECRLKQLR